jgi:hypothetical protein
MKYHNDAATEAIKNIQRFQELQRQGMTVLPPEMRPSPKQEPQQK